MPIIKKGYARRCVPVGARSAADGTGARWGPAGKRTETPREAISAKEAAGAKDVVPRTAIDLIRALPDSFSTGRSSHPLASPFATRCDVLLQHCPRFPPGPRRSRSLVAFLFSTPLRAVPSLRSPSSPPSCFSINVGSPLTANHHFQFSVVQRLRHLLSLHPSRASSCPSATSTFCRFSFFI